MNQFFYTLKKQATNVKMNTEIFTQMLIDEEYIENNTLKTCYFCNRNHFDIMRSGKDVYEYIGKRMKDNQYLHLKLKESIEEIHHLGLLCNWLNFHGIPIFADAEKFPDLAILFCSDCGRVLGIKLDKWYYPYCGYLD